MQGARDGTHKAQNDKRHRIPHRPLVIADSKARIQCHQGLRTSVAVHKYQDHQSC